jgi:GNAT superfamily N-acetyltransferase
MSSRLSRRVAPTRWESYVSRGVSLRFLASIDDEPVAAGQCLVTELGLFLSGSTTLPEARGRGAYRALVQARWDEAVGRGTPALVIGAGAMSRPILERVGFEPLCQLNVLLDPATEPELEPEPGPSDPGAATS